MSRHRAVRLPTSLDRALVVEAERRGASVSDVLRTALEAHLGADAVAAERPPSPSLEEALTGLLVPTPFVTSIP